MNDMPKEKTFFGMFFTPFYISGTYKYIRQINNMGAKQTLPSSCTLPIDRAILFISLINLL